MTTRPLAKDDPDGFQSALQAMARAAEVARARARLGRGFIVVWRDGQMVEESVDVAVEGEQPAAAPDGAVPTTVEGNSAR